MSWCVLAVLLAVGCGDDADSLRVEIDTGVVIGVQQGEARGFLGIPYAAPPTGENRFKPPKPVEPWSEPRDAVGVGTQCYQTFSLSGSGGEEDCLFVNVWAPKDDGTKKAVMVWLHGGAFVFGSGGDPFYRGQHLAEAYDVVVVTVNYRLGALGFLAHPAFAAEDPAYPSSGNWGLDDQIAALQWVQRNIATFGGDPARVTLFGESAGGFSTCAHYTSPRAAGLFAYAISQSGLCAIMFREPSKTEAEAAGVSVAEKVGCSGTGAAAAACLRGKTPEVLLAATNPPAPANQMFTGGPFYAMGNALSTLPNVDGFVLKKPLREAFADGGYEKRPVIIGGVRDEGTLFHSTIFAQEVPDEVDYRAALARRFGAANVDAIVAKYPVASFPSVNRAIAEVSGDSFFSCAMRRAARAMAANGGPTYMYSFEQPPEAPFLQGLGVFHSSEIPFVFGTDPTFPLARVGNGGAAAAQAIQSYWVRFAKTGDPNGDGAPTWSPYDATNEKYLVIAPTIAEQTQYKAALCDFWDAVVP